MIMHFILFYFILTPKTIKSIIYDNKNDWVINQPKLTQ